MTELACGVREGLQVGRIEEAVRTVVESSVRTEVVGFVARAPQVDRVGVLVG